MEKRAHAGAFVLFKAKLARSPGAGWHVLSLYGKKCDFQATRPHGASILRQMRQKAFADFLPQRLTALQPSEKPSVRRLQFESEATHRLAPLT